MRRVLLTAVLIGLVGAAAGAQAPRTQEPPLILDSITGRDSFDRYCAACHGVDGTGDGPATAALRNQPTDLTRLAQRRGGTFPRDEVAAFVEGAGRPVPAHGSGDMPVWGPLFRGLDPSAVRVSVRLRNLVAYIESLQASDEPGARTGTPAGPSGGELFRSYCASCHGADGRGAGPAAQALRELPPNLTEYAIMNDGVFPSVRVREIIDGRHVPAHGSLEMPVWGITFMREPGADEAVVRARIDALVQYLESIQMRRAE